MGPSMGPSMARPVQWLRDSLLWGVGSCVVQGYLAYNMARKALAVAAPGKWPM